MSNNHNIKQKAYFHSADQPTILPVESLYVNRHVEKLIHHGQLEKSMKILEVGAGIGRFSCLLNVQGFDVTASDISPELVSALQKQAPEIPAFVSDVNTLTTNHQERYDAVIGFFMLHHLEDLTVAFKEMSQMLKPGGKMIFCEPNAWFFPFYFQILLNPRMRWSVDKGVMNMRHGILSPALQKSGFNKIEYSNYGYLPPQLYNFQLGKCIDHALDGMPLPDITKAFQIITTSKV